jgi:serine protease Do
VSAARVEVPPAWVEIAKELKPAVVNVSTKRAPDAAMRRNPLGEDLPERFLGFGPPRPAEGVGSGFIINKDGHIVTNNHVVDGATSIVVTLSDGREFKAKVLGQDPKTDLALLKVDAKDLPVIPLGDSTKLQVGEPVMAIGNPFGLEQTVTTGIVSATGRVIGEGPYDSFIQTDASINPGNSGGPLINARGEAVGINTAIVSRTGGSVGIGFAIPVELAKPVVTQLAADGHVTRGFLGVTIQKVTPELAKAFGLSDTRGALVADVTAGSPAGKAGVKAGDVITDYDGRKIARSEDLPRAVAATPVGRRVALTVVRGGKPVALEATIAQLAEPDAKPTAMVDSAGGTLGLSIQPLDPGQARELGLGEPGGVLVVGVREGSPASRAGFKDGDVITEINHRAVKTAEDVKLAMSARDTGKPALFLVHRNGGSLYIAATA